MTRNIYNTSRSSPTKYLNQLANLIPLGIKALTQKIKILKKLDGISHQMFSYQLDILQFISELSEHMQNSDIEGIKQSSALSEIIHRVKTENKNVRSTGRWKQ